MSASAVAAWWGAATGTGSLILLAARFFWDQGADTRATQKELREELRGVLTEIEEAFEGALRALRRGKAVGELPSCLESGPKTIDKLQKRVAQPDPNLLILLSSTISIAQHNWWNVHRHEEDLARDPEIRVMSSSDRLTIVLQAAQTELRERLDKADMEVKHILRQLNDIDKGMGRRS